MNSLTPKLGRDELAAAVADNDAICDNAQHGGDALVGILRELGVEPTGASYVAFQRGLRGLMLVKGGDTAIWEAIHATGGLTDEQQQLVAAMATMWLDGAAAHARASA